MTATNPLALPLDPETHRLEDEATVGEYVAALLNQYLFEGEGFDPKRPFGNSDWDWPIDEALNKAGYSPEQLRQAVRTALSNPPAASALRETGRTATFTVDVRALVAGSETLGPLADVSRERMAQDAKWGEQNHPDGTGSRENKAIAATFRRHCDDATKAGTLTWHHILREEVYEAFAESDPELLREELIQVAAVATAWVEALDRRHKVYAHAATATTEKDCA